MVEKGKNLKNTCKLPCGKNTGTYWKVQGKKSKVITIKRKVVVCTVTAATPTNAIMVMYLLGVTCELYASASDDAFQGPIQGLYQYSTMSVVIVIKKQFGAWEPSRADDARSMR